MAFFSASSAARCLCCRAAFKVFAKSCHSPRSDPRLALSNALSHSVLRSARRLSLPQIQGHCKLSWVCSICNHPQRHRVLIYYIHVSFGIIIFLQFGLTPASPPDCVAVPDPMPSTQTWVLNADPELRSPPNLQLWPLRSFYTRYRLPKCW